MKQRQSNRKNEKPVEDYLVKKVKELGGMSLKWPAIGRRGVPDRICVLPQTGTIFVEVKADGNSATKLQLHTIQQINDSGGIALVVEGKSGVNEFVSFVKTFDKGDTDGQRGGHETSRVLH
jgi:hypothetical protein